MLGNVSLSRRWSNTGIGVLERWSMLFNLDNACNNMP